jgi:hypothetical protein
MHKFASILDKPQPFKYKHNQKVKDNGIIIEKFAQSPTANNGIIEKFMSLL